MLVEKCGKENRGGGTALRACSACAGDYEDPERTAWPDAVEAADAEMSDGELEVETGSEAVRKSEGG